MSKNRTGKPRVLIVHTGHFSIFADRDREILVKRYAVETFGFTGFGGWFDLRARMKSADIVIFWFVGRAAFMSMFPPPKGPKIVSLVGGYESARIEEFGYGSALSFWKRRIIKSILRRSHRVIAVSNCTMRELGLNYDLPESHITVIYNAIDTRQFIPPAQDAPRSGVFTAGHLDRVLIRKKGYDVLVDAARRLPDVRFAIAGRLVGPEVEEFVRCAPNNVDFLGEISQEELRLRIQSAKVYFQPSRHESFGVSVIEAMSCGCVPVVSNMGALPEVVGDSGYVLESLEIEHVTMVLRAALDAPPEAHNRARAHVVEHFDIGLRGERLSKLIDDLLAC